MTTEACITPILLLPDLAPMRVPDLSLATPPFRLQENELSRNARSIPLRTGELIPPDSRVRGYRPGGMETRRPIGDYGEELF